MRRKSDIDFIEDPETGCWEWQLAIIPGGYAETWRDGRVLYAHRLFYEDFVGPIPAGLTIDHLCRNRACVNPGHLEPVTNRENVLRGQGPCAVNARKTHCKRGHELTPENIYTQPSQPTWRNCRKCIRLRSRKKVLAR